MPHLVNRGEAVDAANEFDVTGAPGSIGPYALHVLPDRQLGSGIIPAKRQVHDAQRHHDIVEIRNLRVAAVDSLEQCFAFEAAAVVSNVERANSWRDLENAREPRMAQPVFESVHPEAEVEIEYVGSIFDQQTAVSIGPAHHTGALAEDRCLDARSGHGGTWRKAWQCARQRFDRGVQLPLQADRLDERDGAKADPIAGLELTDLPTLAFDHRRGTNEAAQAGTIGAQDHWHVAGEIDGSDRIGVIVDVGRMEPGLTAVFPRPYRFRPD